MIVWDFQFLYTSILMFAILGMNGNFEIKGYNEFSISVNEKMTEDYSSNKNEIGNIINSCDKIQSKDANPKITWIWSEIFKKLLQQIYKYIK